MTAAGSFEIVAAELRAQDREAWLACLWSPSETRPAVAALLGLDRTLVRVAAEAKDMMLAEIRLAWWREQLDRLARGEDAPSQPLLRLLATHASPLTELDRLARLEDALLPLVCDGPFSAATYMRLRGHALFEALYAASGGSSADGRAAARAAGIHWAAASLWRNRWGQATDKVHAARAELDLSALPEVHPRPLPRALRVLARAASLDIDAVRANRAPGPPATAGRQLALARAALLAR
jgi:phytoene synthase